MKTQKERDLIAASEICSEFGRYECLDATEEMVKEFGDEIKVLYICTLDKALAPYIVCLPKEKEVITTTHNHYATFLHDLVFDNEFPKGLPLDDWLNAYMYINMDDIPTCLSHSDIQWMSVEQFINRNGSEEAE